MNVRLKRVYPVGERRSELHRYWLLYIANEEPQISRECLAFFSSAPNALTRYKSVIYINIRGERDSVFFVCFGCAMCIEHIIWDRQTLTNLVYALTYRSFALYRQICRHRAHTVYLIISSLHFFFHHFFSRIYAMLFSLPSLPHLVLFIRNTRTCFEEEVRDKQRIKRKRA